VRIRTSRAATSAALAIAALTVLAACTSSHRGPSEGSSGTSSTSGGKLIIGTTNQIVSLDPNGTSDTLGRSVVAAYDDSLYRAVPDGDPAPDMAIGPPEASPDGLSYTVKLRQDVKFGDGTPLTAGAYVKQFDRALSLNGDGPNTRVIPYVESVTATDDYTLVFHLKGKFALFPSLLMYNDYAPSNPKNFPANKLVNLPKPPVYGTGPYILQSYSVSSGQIVFTPNPYYFGEKAPWDQVIIRIFDTPQTMALSLSNGEIDVAWKDLSSEQLQTLKSHSDITEASFAPGLFDFAVNHKMAPTDDPNVDQAISAVLDRDAAIDKALGGVGATALYSPIPPGVLGSADVFRTKFEPPNVSMATQLLAQSGYSKSKPVPLVVGYSSSQWGSDYGNAVQALVDQLNATGLFDAHVKDNEWTTYLAGLQAGDTYNIGLLDKSPGVDPDFYTSIFINASGVGTFITDEKNKPLSPAGQEFLDQLHVAATTLDEKARVQAYAKLLDRWATTVPTIPLWTEEHKVAYLNDKVQGPDGLANSEAFSIGANDILYLDRIRPAG
jgi:peptide/nickel transport system substrate-binding protein